MWKWMSKNKYPCLYSRLGWVAWDLTWVAFRLLTCPSWNSVLLCLLNVGMFLTGYKWNYCLHMCSKLEAFVFENMRDKIWPRVWLWFYMYDFFKCLLLILSDNDDNEAESPDATLFTTDWCVNVSYCCMVRLWCKIYFYWTEACERQEMNFCQSLKRGFIL